MKITDRHPSTQYERTEWIIFSRCAILIGQILDDKFEKPYLYVYEHQRHTSYEAISDTFTHSPASQVEELAIEEQELSDVINSPETERRLVIIGDVGVGKTTFLRHMIELHFSTAAFGPSIPIYLDWKAFTAPLTDPIPFIHRRFVDDVYFALEKGFPGNELSKLDDQIFRSAPMFSTSRSLACRYPPDREPGLVADALEKALRERPVELVFERLNALCEIKRNSIIVIIDNIDHLHPRVLEHLFQFMIEIQVRTICLVIVAMRDHTFASGRSMYRRDAITQSWRMTLKAPNVRRLLERRLTYFLSANRGQKSTAKIQISDRSIGFDVGVVSRGLIMALFSEVETYEFLVAWSNFNIRVLFCVIQSILQNLQVAECDAVQFLADPGAFAIGLDDCIIALGLDRFLMFYPDKSSLFNPYSSGMDGHFGDKLLGVRIIEFLNERTSSVSRGDLKKTFLEWGYDGGAFESQIMSMANKDILWTTAGPPSDIDDKTGIRLSYRGKLYKKILFRRAVFNYMMSFDTHVNSDSNYRSHKLDYKPDLREELRAFSTLKGRIDADIFAARILDLTESIFDSEEKEMRELQRKSQYVDFRRQLSPDHISVLILDGLTALFLKVLQPAGKEFRLTQPSSQILQKIADFKERYCGALN